MNGMSGQQHKDALGDAWLEFRRQVLKRLLYEAEK
jgi:hypothetical protein